MYVMQKIALKLICSFRIEQNAQSTISAQKKLKLNDNKNKWKIALIST
jgi:hypothetical protein